MSYNTNLQNKNNSLRTILDKINSLPEASSGVELPELTNPANESEVFLNKEVIDQKGEKITGTFTIDEELNDIDDLLTELESSLTDKVSGVKPVLQDKTVTPTADDQTIVADSGYDGLNQVTIKGDANLIPSNIISGKSIFGVQGSASGGGSGETTTVTGTLQAYGPAFDNSIGGTVYYIDANGSLQSTAISGSIIVMQNTIVVGASNGDGQRTSGNISDICGTQGGVKTYYVTGDFTLKI